MKSEAAEACGGAGDVKGVVSGGTGRLRERREVKLEPIKKSKEKRSVGEGAVKKKGLSEMSRRLMEGLREFRERKEREAGNWIE